MFKRFLQASSAETHFTETLNGSHNGLSVPSISEAKLSPFDEIYRKAAFQPAPSTAAWDILKVADVVSSSHLHGLSPAAKHSALMMALESAGVAVEDMLQDAIQRQRVLNEYEDSQRRRLADFETAKHHEKERLSSEMDAVCAQYQMRINAGEQEIERERAMFREWQERKEREQRRISEAASACVSADSCGSSDYSISRLLEKNSGRLRESA